MKGAAVSLAKHQRATHKDAMRIATETAFLDGWLLQQKLPLILLQYKSAKEVFLSDKNKHHNNLLNKNMWLTSQATYAEELATVDSYKDDIAEAEKILKFYTGISLSMLPKNKPTAPKLTKLNWNPEQKITIKSLSYYFQKGFAYRKDLKEKQDSINSEAHSSQYYTKQYLPNVSLFGEATKNTIRRGNSTLSKSAGINISWNTFDGLSNYFNKSAADARKTKAILEKHDLINQIKLEIQTAYTALQKEMKNFEAQNVSYKQAKNEYILKRQQFDTGLISKVDFKTAEYTYETARHAWLTQSATTALKELELLYSCGYPPKNMQI
jgi:outer membrane protein TolC